MINGNKMKICYFRALNSLSSFLIYIKFRMFKEILRDLKLHI